MKYLLIVLIVLLVGCKTTQYVYVDVPVWTPPAFEKPVRPVLKSINNSKLDASSKLDISSKNVETDMNDLATYANQLESIIQTISTYRAASAVQPTGVK